MSFITAAQLSRLAPQEASRAWVRRTAEPEAWKKEFEFSRRRDIGWHCWKVALARNLLKKSGQALLVKLEPMEVSKGVGRGAEDWVPEGAVSIAVVVVGAEVEEAVEAGPREEDVEVGLEELDDESSNWRGERISATGRGRLSISISPLSARRRSFGEVKAACEVEGRAVIKIMVIRKYIGNVTNVEKRIDRLRPGRGL